MHEPSFLKALRYVEERFKVPLEDMRFTQLLSSIEAIRNSAARGEQYRLAEALREALNEQGYTDPATRERYKAGVGKYYAELKLFRAASPKKQVSLVGTVCEEPNGQYKFIV